MPRWRSTARLEECVSVDSIDEAKLLVKGHPLMRMLGVRATS